MTKTVKKVAFLLALLTSDSIITVLITPENTPINSSPRYTFKIWSKTQQNIQLKITYNEGVKFYLGVDSSQWPYDKPLYILIDQQLGGSWVRKVKANDLPVSMIIE